MTLLLDAFWRAAAYCLHPRIILLSLAPLVISGGLAFGLGWFFWGDAIEAVQGRLETWDLVTAMLGYLDSIGAGAFRAVIAPLVVVIIALPVIVVLALLLVAALITPSAVRLVAQRRFPALERKHGSSLFGGLVASLWRTILALVVFVITMPLWLIPPLVLVLPPLIWGWLTYRVMSFDALAEHASRDERRAVLREHRWPMLGMGVVAGYLAAAPSLLWAVSATMLVLAPLVILVSIWLYTLVFVFSALWFAHYCLAALERLRAAAPTTPAEPYDGSVVIGRSPFDRPLEPELLPPPLEQDPRP